MKKFFALLLLALFLAGCLEESFEQSYSKLTAIERKYNVSGNSLAPGTRNELSDFASELIQLKQQVKEKESDNTKAITLLIESRLEVIAMETAFLDAGEYMTGVGTIPDCSGEGLLNKATEKYDEAMTKAQLAMDKRNIFLKKFREQTKTTSLKSGDGFDSVLKQLIEVNSKTKKDLQNRCA